LGQPQVVSFTRYIMDVLSEVGSTLGYFCALGTVQCTNPPVQLCFSVLS